MRMDTIKGFVRDAKQAYDAGGSMPEARMRTLERAGSGSVASSAGDVDPISVHGGANPGQLSAPLLRG